MNRILSLFFILIYGLSYSQLSVKVSELVYQLSKSEIGESKFVNYDGRESEVFKIYDTIAKIASKREVKYLAFEGSPIIRYYFSMNLVDSKSNKLKKLFNNFTNSNDSLQVKQGCVVTTINLANNLYQEVYNIPKQIKEAKGYKEILQSQKYSNDEFLISELKSLSTNRSRWTEKEARKIIVEFDKVALDDKNTPKKNIEFICMINQYFENKIPYFIKLRYFEKKYNSKIILEYLNYCLTH
jgi:uncharacterized protein YozE (UPF0346 family)